MQQQITVKGISAALLTPVFLGMAPIFGKLANNAGASPFAVAAVRTIIAVAILWVVYGLFFRKFIFIHPAGLTGCVIVGTINGIGSLFYYSGLSLLDASLTQLINGMYLVFALLLTRIGGEKISARVWLRVALSLLGLVIITGFSGNINPLGVGFMLGSALMFAGTVVFSQYVLFELPSPTATLYILTTMAVIVTMAWLPTGQYLPTDSIIPIMMPIFMLGLTTALARLVLFASVKFLGSLQSAITALAEIAVALLLAFLVLDETLSGTQWLGVLVLGGSLLLIRQEDLRAQGFDPNSLLIANQAGIQFQQIAFHRAFGGAVAGADNEQHTMASITTMEMVAIRDMMGVDGKPVDPFPINQMQRGLEEHDGGYSVNLQEFLDNYEGNEG